MVGGGWVKSYFRTRIARLVPSMRRLAHLSRVSFPLLSSHLYLFSSLSLMPLGIMSILERHSLFFHFLSFSFIFFHFLSFSDIFFHVLSCSFMFFHFFLSFSFNFIHFLSFPFIFFHFLSFSFIFFHFLSFSFIFFPVLSCFSFSRVQIL